MMNTQEQIDYLKRQVLQLNQEVLKMRQAFYLINEDIMPSFGEWRMARYDGAQCSTPASECPCGIGV